MRQIGRRGALAAIVAGLLVSGSLLTPVFGQTGSALTVRMREVSFDSSGRTRVIVSVSGTAVAGSTLSASSFEVTESGQPVEELEVQELFASQAQAVAVALLMDESDSAEGEPIAAAQQAATDFVRALPEGVQIAVISFSDGPILRQDFTTDRDAVIQAIGSLELRRGTALYDAVDLAADRLVQSQADAQRNIVIFSDGSDVGSEATLAEVVQRLKEINTPVTTVLLQGRGVDAGAMRTLAGAEQGGQFISVADPAQVQAAFDAVAQAISSQYVLTYASDDVESSELSIEVTATASGFSVSDTSVVLNNRIEVAPTPPQAAPGPFLPFLASPLGFVIGIAAAFIGVLLFFVVLLVSPAEKRTEKLLARRLRLYSKGDKKVKERRESSGLFGASSFAKTAVGLAERIPRPKDFDEKMQKELDRSGWPMRSTEFILIQIGGGLGLAILAVALFRNVFIAAMLMIAGVLLPRIFLSIKVQKRTSTFLEQLPDTLQLLAGSLSAGYGFMQALDTVTKEATPPTSTEFARVLSETRLGMPMEDAMDAMADRIGSVDFKWVVLAINIQRQVGGNLAALLTTVANTLREREQVRRQIKVLSAEGRLSAIILIVLPFALFGYLSLINPEYIGELTGASIGRIAIAVALVLIGLGSVWMRKIIKIDV